MNIKQHILRRLAFFVRDTSATATIEFAIIAPLLAAWFVGSFTFFDGYKSRNATQKAAFNIVDILSRKETDANEALILGLQRLYDEMVFTRGSNAIRVSSIKWDEDTLSHSIDWSCSAKSTLPARTEASLTNAEFTSRIPIMSDEEHIILVETYTDYATPFNVGWGTYVWEEFVAMKPRFSIKIGFVRADPTDIYPCD